MIINGDILINKGGSKTDIFHFTGYPFLLKFVEIVFVGTAFVEIVFVGTVFIGLLVGIVFDGAVSVGTVFVNFISHNY